MVLDIELHAQYGDHSIAEICTIVRDDPLWGTIPTDEILFNKPGYNILGNGSERGCLNPLCKIFNGH